MFGIHFNENKTIKIRLHFNCNTRAAPMTLNSFIDGGAEQIFIFSFKVLGTFPSSSKCIYINEIIEFFSKCCCKCIEIALDNREFQIC